MALDTHFSRRPALLIGFFSRYGITRNGTLLVSVPLGVVTVT